MPNYKNIVKKLARERINFLFNLANNIFPQNKKLANRYVDLARRYAKRAKLKIPIIWRNRICHNCKNYIYPGLNSRIRLQSRKGKASHISITCFECKHITRHYIKKRRNIIFSKE